MSLLFPFFHGYFLPALLKKSLFSLLFKTPGWSSHFVDLLSSYLAKLSLIGGLSPCWAQR